MTLSLWRSARKLIFFSTVISIFFYYKQICYSKLPDEKVSHALHSRGGHTRNLFEPHSLHKNLVRESFFKATCLRILNKTKSSLPENQAAALRLSQLFWVLVSWSKTQSAVLKLSQLSYLGFDQLFCCDLVGAEPLSCLLNLSQQLICLPRFLQNGSFLRIASKII